MGGGVVGADVHAEDDEFAGEGGHAVLVGDGVAVEDEAAEPLGLESLPIAAGGFDAGVALPAADEEGEGCELGRGVGRELAEDGIEELLMGVILWGMIHESGLRECCWGEGYPEAHGRSAGCVGLVFRREGTPTRSLATILPQVG